MGWKNIMSISIPHARTHYGKILLLCLSLVCFCTHGFAGGYNHSTFTDPAIRDLPKRIDLAQAYRLKSEYERELINTADTSDKNTINEQSFLKALLTYDNLRLEISDVLLYLVNEYKLSGKFANTLTGFSETFRIRIKEAQSQVHNLATYKAYSNTFSLTYAALIYALSDDPVFFQRFKDDLQNAETVIGNYKTRLDIAYEGLSEKHHAYLNFEKKRQLEERINLLNTLITERKLAHHLPSKQP